MTIDGREIVFKPEFFKSLDLILEYYAKNNSAQFIQNFSKELDRLIIEKIAPRPESHPEYKWKKTPEKIYRRAIFRKKYFVIFKNNPQKLEFLLIVYSGQDLKKIFVE